MKLPKLCNTTLNYAELRQTIAKVMEKQMMQNIAKLQN